MEKKLNFAVRFLSLSKEQQTPATRSIEFLAGATTRAMEHISPDQADAMRRILKMCQDAVHGLPIAESEAREIVELAHQLENSFALGYSINFTPNENAQMPG